MQILNVNIINSTNGLIIYGGSSNDQFGTYTAFGDVNGDNKLDMLVGAPNANIVITTGTPGEAYVIYDIKNIESGFDITQLDGANGYTVYSYADSIIPYDDRLGNAVAFLGDINGDGVGDFAVSDPWIDARTNEDGRVYMIFGSDYTSINFQVSSLNGNNGFIFEGTEFRDHLAAYEGAMANLGDINGDGVNDFGFGAEHAKGNGLTAAGQIYILFGGGTFPSLMRRSAIDGNNGFMVNGLSANDRLYKISAAGDINNDGINDIILGQSGRNAIAGGAYIIFGSNQGFPAEFNLSNLNGVNGFKIEGSTSGEMLGSSSRHLGDINGDGISDIAIGIPGSIVNGQNNVGEVVILFGKNGSFAASYNIRNLDNADGFILQGTEAEGFFGRSIGTLGDINGDSISDIAVGSNVLDYNGAIDVGGIYIVYGRNTGFDSVVKISDIANYFIHGENPQDNLHITQQESIDINGDNINDIVLGAPNADYNGNTNIGKVYILYGVNDSNECKGGKINIGSGNWCTEEGSEIYAIDINKDGKQDLFCHNSKIIDSVNNHIMLNHGVGIYSSINSDINGAMNLGSFNGTWCIDPQKIYFADFNGDGYTDLYCNDPQISLERGTININNFVLISANNATTFTSMDGLYVNGSIAIDGGIWCGAENITDPHKILISDLDGNGMDDLICQGPNGIQIMLSNGTAFNAIDNCYEL